MPEASSSNPRKSAGVLFFCVLVVSMCLCALAAARSGDDQSAPLRLLPEEVTLAVRLLLFICGAALSWAVGRWLYKFLVRGFVPMAESLSGALAMLFFGLLLFVMIAFIGELPWAVILVLLLMVLAFSIPAFWRLLGGRLAGAILAVAFVVAGATFYLTAVA